MAAKPFKLVKQEKDQQKRLALPREVNGLLWADLQSNIGGDWGFKGESFSLKILFATGVVTSSHKWLIGVFENGDDLFEIQHRKAEGKNEKGWPNWVANPEEEQVKQKWVSDGCLTAICCDGIPQLEMLAEWAQNRFIFNDLGYEVYPGKNPDKALFTEITNEILDKQDSSYGASRLNKKHKEFQKDNSWIYLLFNAEDLEATENPLIGETFSYEINDEGLVSSVTVDWTEPEVKSSGNRSGGGSRGQTEKERITDRVSVTLELFGKSSLDDVALEAGISSASLKLSMVLGSFVNLPLKESGKEPGKEETVDSVGFELVDGMPSIAPQTNGHNPEEGSMWLGMILQMKGERSLPKEVDAEYLKAQGMSWCGRFYSVLNGTIEGNRPYVKGQETRKVNTFVNLKFGKPLFELSVKELGELIHMPEFKSQAALAVEAGEI